MTEEHIFFSSGEIKLEGILKKGSAGMGLVAAHPHPLYGGSMDDWVVSMMTAAAENQGWTSLRFNFRGVGLSQGKHDGGKGEIRDMAAAAGFLLKQGHSPVVAAGYSFGAFVAANGWPEFKNIGVETLILVAPPAGMMDFQSVGPETKIGLIVAGETDEIAPPDLARELGERLSPPLAPVVIPGANHFFGPAREEVVRVISDFLGTFS